MSRKKKNSRKQKQTGASKAAIFAAIAQGLYWTVKIIKELRE